MKSASSIPVLFAAFLVALCCGISLLIIEKVPYTEIDWRAYMQEVAGFIGGERDYIKLRGDTGPLVYPAVFVYLFSFLYDLTDAGTNILMAQYIFAGLLVLFSALVLAGYLRARPIPLLVLPLLVLSRRIYAIFVLRLFNDSVALFFLFAALLATQCRRPHLGAVLYSLGVGVKMNLFLFAPAFAALWVGAGGLGLAAKLIGVCAVVQLLAGAPFLLTHPHSYVTKAFELSRVFTYKWTVNWRFLDEATFQSKPLAMALLAATVMSWVILLATWAVRARAWRALQVAGVAHHEATVARAKSVQSSRASAATVVASGGATTVRRRAADPCAGECDGDASASATSPTPTAQPDSPETRLRSRSRAAAPDPALVDEHAVTARDGLLGRLVYALGTTANASSDMAALAVRRGQVGVHSFDSDASAAYSGLDPLELLAVSNLVGVVFCRSLHAQFYVWYYHTIPYIIAACVPPCTPWALRIAVVAVIELCWNVYPPTGASSAALQVAHAALYALVMAESVRKAMIARRWTKATPAVVHCE